MRGVSPSRRVPQPTCVPTPEDLAWAAGFIEGEGSFTRFVMPSGSIAFRVSASQSYIEPLEKLQKIFGGSIKPKKSGKTWREEQKRFVYTKTSNTWRVYGEMAKTVCTSVMPWLSHRRQCEARELLELTYKNPHKLNKGPKRGKGSSRI